MWSLLLSLALLCAQGVKLHVHDLDHGHDNHHSHAHVIDEASDHGHLSKAHSSHDTSHDDHHDSVASEIDVSPDGVLKNSNTVFALALIVFFITLMIPASLRQRVHHRRENDFILHRDYALSPPLRAPPQN